MKIGYIRTTSTKSLSKDLHEFFEEFDENIVGLNSGDNSIKEAKLRKMTTLELIITEERVKSWNKTKIDELIAVFDRVKLLDSKYGSYHVEKLHDYLALVVLEVNE